MSNRLKELFNINESDHSKNNINYENKKYITITEKNELINMIEKINKKYFAFDTETSGLNPLMSNLVGISISCEENSGWYIPIGHNEGKQLQLDDINLVIKFNF